MAKIESESSEHITDHADATVLGMILRRLLQGKNRMEPHGLNDAEQECMLASLSSTSFRETLTRLTCACSRIVTNRVYG